MKEFASIKMEVKEASKFASGKIVNKLYIIEDDRNSLFIEFTDKTKIVVEYDWIYKIGVTE